MRSPHTLTLKNRLCPLLALASAAMLLSACSPAPVMHHNGFSPQTAATCQAPRSLKSDEAFAQARQTLENPTCFPHFDNVFMQLKTVAAGDPGEQNDALFAGFINWSQQNGILTHTQASNLYNSYFREVFVSLPAQGPICSYQPRKDELQQQLTQEVKHKREGMVGILGRKDAYERAYSQYQELAFVLDMAQRACQG